MFEERGAVADAEIQRAIERHEHAGERVINAVRWLVVLVGATTLALVGSAQAAASRWMFGGVIVGYATYSGVIAMILRRPRHRPLLKYVVTTIDIGWMFLLPLASLLNYSGIYEVYRAPITWLLIAFFNALTALRLSTRLSLFAGVLTLALGFLQLVVIDRVVGIPWVAASEYVGHGLHFGDISQTIVFSALPAFAAAGVALFARRMVVEAARGSIESARVEAERARALAERDLARESAAMKERFLSIASHELRSPLNALALATGILENLGPDQTQRVGELHVRITRQTKRLMNLVEHLLDSSRLTQAEVVLDREPCDLGTLCGEVAAELDPEGSRIALLVEPQLSGSWDPGRLYQVITNLASNALRYSPPQASVTLVARRSADRAVVEIRDRGIGIPREDLPHLFDPFFRGDRARHHDAAGVGLGLGLHIVSELVRLHGGSIQVESGASSGSTFTVELPFG